MNKQEHENEQFKEDALAFIVGTLIACLLVVPIFWFFLGGFAVVGDALDTVVP